MSVEYQEVRWIELLSEVLTEAAPHDLRSRDEIKGAWNLLPQWIEMQHNRYPLTEVYDIGAGMGLLGAFVTLLSPSCHVVAVDADPITTVLSIRQKYGLYYEICDICQSAARIGEATPNVVDAIILADVIQFFHSSPVQVFELLFKILKPGGMLYVSCPDSSGNHGKIYKYVTGYKEIPKAVPSLDRPAPGIWEEVFWNYSKVEVLEIAATAGFRFARFGYSVTSKGQHLNFAFVK